MKSVQDLFNGLSEKFGIDMREAQEIFEEEQNKPLVAAVFGQTGVGKSSLTNALFGTHFNIDDISPCTKEPQKHSEKTKDGKVLTFWDLPGIGESVLADDQYIKRYIEIAKTCDIVLWVFQADTRSVLADKLALKRMVDSLDDDNKQIFLSKITVLLTKSDTINSDGWILAKDGNKLITTPSPKAEEVLSKKAEYFYYELLNDYAENISHSIMLNTVCKKNIELHSNLYIDLEQQKLVQKGKITDEEWEFLLEKYPKYNEELLDLRNSQKAIVCSSKYNYNLNEVKFRIFNRSEGMSIFRISDKINGDLQDLEWKEIVELGLPLVYDIKTEKELFSVQTLYEGE